MYGYTVLVSLSAYITYSFALNLNYLDPTKLQTKTNETVQQETAASLISQYATSNIVLEVDRSLFIDNKDAFVLRTIDGYLHIRASTGVAAVWGFNYYLKKYCKSHIGWQVERVEMPETLPEVDETVVANDRFRYYQNVCTASYSFVWWSPRDWIKHVLWMALNGINLSLAPVAQEAAWARVYSQLGMTDDEIDHHFTGPAFLSWLRMGNVRGWGGPLPQSWHRLQTEIQIYILDYMFRLGMVPVLPAFNGHVPRAFSRIYPNATFHEVSSWNGFGDDYCCGLFLDPSDPLFKTVGTMFVNEIAGSTTGHVYTADPFNEVKVEPWSTDLVRETARAIFSTLSDTDGDAVWLIQNWMFVHDPILWPKSRVKSFLTAVPEGRMLVLDLQSEQWPQYDLYEMYFGQPFLWCMLHNFGGTLGMFGNMRTINEAVYEVRSRANTTMIGIGLTPEGINQNYVVYDLMLESAWRPVPVRDLAAWVAEYAERRYGCNSTAAAWRSLLNSVYSFDGLNRVRGKYVVTRRPSFDIKPWAWYRSYDLFDAFKRFTVDNHSQCDSPGFYHDLADVTRQALQYRAEQLYLNVLKYRFSTSYVFEAAMNQFLDVMDDMSIILSMNKDFTVENWLLKARNLGTTDGEKYLYEMNARYQITLWGPNGEIFDYACKQWAEMFRYYYIPRWKAFLTAALDAKVKDEFFDERSTQKIVTLTVEKPFLFDNRVNYLSYGNIKTQALYFYKKWAFTPGVEDLPLNVIKRDPNVTRAMAASRETSASKKPRRKDNSPTVVMLQSTTPL